ncbi:hypothetical protein ABH930_007045 [Kitasatospora sp. GAS204A]|uniref:hypothetical protein n=1 Tax=unclassified Kitasatospora TaxID=2633591 RepID=UPI002475380B|nr:hypothetical protein [Kitasatospora sp. GAS204B]MDH6122765.1 hypothetical protein [Kitasatospora sp. GAS204B]
MLTGAICYALTAGGLVLAGLHAWRRRWRTATRWAGLALLPAGVYLTGLVPVGTAIGRAVGHWATRLVFDPRVWTGIVLLGIAVLLLALSRLGVGGKGSGSDGGAAQGRRSEQAHEPRRPTSPAGSAAPTAVAPTKGKSAAEELGDFSDIEEILRKRGI